MEVNKVNLFMRRAERKPDKSVTMTTTNKMAAEEGAVSAGFQQFPLTTHPLPNEEEMKEQICIALNLKDGQQSAGQSTEDPYTQAIKYIEKHRIMEVFQNITARLAYDKPEDPIQFVLEEIRKIKDGKKTNELK